MKQVATATGLPGVATPIEARVVGHDAGRVRLRALRASTPHALEARVALPGYQAATGDRVLVQRSDVGDAFVVGVVHAGLAATNDTKVATVATAGGASAAVEGEVISLRAEDGALIARYDASSGELLLSAPEHLRLRATNGARLSLEAGKLEVRADEAHFTVGRWRLVAGEVVERSRDVLRTVDGLLETRARRARSLVERTFELVAGRTTLRSECDTHIDGKRVLLG